MEMRDEIKEVVSDETAELFEESSNEAITELHDIANVSIAAMLLEGADEDLRNAMLNQVQENTEGEE